MYLHYNGEFNVFHTKDFLLVNTFDWLFYYSMKDISTFIKSLSSKDRVYVEFNDAKAMVNGSVKYMSVPARLADGNPMVPLRFVSENLGYKVGWEKMDREV